MALLAEARKRVAADRAVAGNADHYAALAERQRGIAEQTGMNRHLPPEPIDPAAVAERWSARASDHGLLVLRLDVGAPLPLEPLPAEHRGDAPYAYRLEQLFERHPVTLEVAGASARQLQAWLAELNRAEEPLFVVETHRVGDRATRVDGHILSQAAIAPLLHRLEPLTADAVAAAAGVAPPDDEATRARLATLLDEHRALTPSLEAARAALGQAHLAGARFAVYRQLIEQLQERPLGRPLDE